MCGRVPANKTYTDHLLRLLLLPPSNGHLNLAVPLEWGGMVILGNRFRTSANGAVGTILPGKSYGIKFNENNKHRFVSLVGFGLREVGQTVHESCFSSHKFWRAEDGINL